VPESATVADKKDFRHYVCGTKPKYDGQTERQASFDSIVHVMHSNVRKTPQPKP